MTLAKDVEHGKLIKKIFKVDRPVAEDPNDDTSPLIFTITTDVRDREGDIVQPTGIMVENYRNNAVMQWAHKYDELPIGKSVEMWAQKIKSVSKDGEPVEQDGIKAAVQFQPDSNYHDSYSGLRGSMVRRMYQTGFLNAVSIGFDPYQWDEIEEKDEDRTESPGLWGNGTNFTKWDLLEFSAVPVPANPQAVMDRAATFGHDKDMVKAFLKEMTDFCVDDRCQKAKGVIPYKQTGKAPDDTKWSGPSEVSAATIEDLNVICAWKDSSKPAAEITKGDFKLPHHTADGHLLVRAGLVGCGNAIQGARGGVNIPDSDIAGVKSHLAKHYVEFEMTAPWEPKGYIDNNPVYGTVTSSTSNYSDANVAWTWTGDTEKDMTEKKIESLNKRIAELEAQVKAGRVLSSKNEADLRKADSLTDQCGELIEGVLEQATGKPVVEPADEGSDVAPAAGKEIPRQVTIKYPLGHEAPEVIEVMEEPITEPTVAEPETEIVESDDDIIVVDEDDLLRVINGISDDDELPDEIEAELSLSQRETGETETEV